MSGFGFDKAKSGEGRAPVSAKALAKKIKPISVNDDAEEKAIAAGEKVGFVERERQEKVDDKPKGRRRREIEPQGRLLITGPERILERFREFADVHDHKAYWNAIEALMLAFDDRSKS